MKYKDRYIPISNKIRQSMKRKKNWNRLKELLVCREFYYSNRKDYTYNELNELDNAVELQKGEIK